MSKFSGKCDIYDWFGMIAKEENETPYECFVRRNAKIYTNDALVTKADPIKIEKPSDLVMYYPYVSASMVCNNNKGEDTIYLSSRPYPCLFLDIGKPETYVHYTEKLMKEYWRVRNEEDPKYVS